MAVPSRRAQVTIAPARWPGALPLAREMFLEYAESLNFDLCFQGFEQELAGLPGGYAPPDGGLWFGRVDGAAAGIVALRPFGENGARDRVCEMKRLWVRPAFRGHNLGRRLALLTLEAARAAGYRRMRLDTLPFMERAQALYVEFGFRDVSARVADPHPELIYMELDLTAATPGGRGSAMAARYFDDFEVGERFATSGVTVTEALITDFALTYDPQPIHIDAEAAKETHFGGLVASGFQTMALAWRLFYQENVIAAASLGSPGVDKLRWHRPVRPGDTIRATVEVRDTRPSGSKLDRGYMTLAYEVTNQDGERVTSFLCTHILRRRAGG